MACACLLVHVVAFAHTVGISRGDYLLQGNVVALSATFSKAELALAVPALERDDAPPGSYGPEARAALAAWALAGYSVSASEQPCRAGDVRIDASEGDGVQIALVFTCVEKPRRLQVKADWVTALSGGHRHIAHVVWEGGSREIVVHRGAAAFEVEVPSEPIDEQASPAKTAWLGQLRTYVGMGIEHILTGYDHLLFVVGLLLVFGPLRSLIAAVTAFTVAHSLTLGLATVASLSPSPRLIEPLIALSIAYVGVENWFVGDAVGRWRLTFVFGLIHGFGFAGALREVAIPEGDLVLALFGFNLGVESAQLAVMALVLPILLVSRSRGWLSARAARLLSVPIAVMGFVWFVARLASV